MNDHPPGAVTHLSHSTARPPPAARASYRSAAPPSVSLSPLTTRSSSSTRLNQLDPTVLSPGDRPSANEAYRAWRRESKERTSLSQQRKARLGSTTPPLTLNGHSKKKGKAVAFVIGAHSSGSGEDADAEVDLLSKDEQEDDEQARIRIKTAFVATEPTIEDLIRSQIRQPEYTLDPLNLDPLLPLGIADYTFVLSTPTSSSSADASPASEPAGNVPPPPHPHRVSLGKGKFSEVLLARKGDVEYALKHTPLHPHHPLIATRLLREPTILAQLLPHPNLVKVFETIRTPGHFYLVEENLRSSVTLEQLVASSPGGILPLNLAWSVLEQLSSVVHSLHQPLRVCHRDIKPENILVRGTPPTEPEGQPTLLLKLLDFGLATHFSSSEPKLTTCCGSPAYHSPELWRGLREPSGTVKYWGPEVDIWCTGLSLLRCLTVNKYPLGISHSSISAMSDKVVDALLAVEDESMRRVLAGLLQMDGAKRMESFEEYCQRNEVVRRSKDDWEWDNPPNQASHSPNPATASPPTKKEFKSTDFIPTSPLFSLDLPLLSASDLPDGPKPLEVSVHTGDEPAMVIRSRSPSRSRPRHCQQSSMSSAAKGSSTEEVPALRTPGPSSSPDLTPDPYSPRELADLSLPTTPVTPYSNPFAALSSPHHSSFPPPIQIILLNPTNEPIRRATSFIKYALRCAGVLYHVRDDLSASSGFSALGQPSPHISSLHDLPPSPSAYEHSNSALDDPNTVTYLQCVLRLPLNPTTHTSKASSALIAALRPPMIRAQTMDNPVRSSSTPPIGTANKGGKAKKEPDVKCTTFFLSIRKGEGSVHADRRSESSGRKKRNRRDKERIVLTLSDERALRIVRDALRIDLAGPTTSVGDAGGTEQRGRPGPGERKEMRSPKAGSGSRDARLRRTTSTFVGTYAGADKTFDDNAPVKGLAMSMGPPGSNLATPTVERKGFFDYVGGLGGRLGGLMTPGGSRNSSTFEVGLAARKEDERRSGGVPVVSFV